MTADYNKKISLIKYNFLHLPQRIDHQDGRYAEFVYDASGVKHQMKNNIIKDHLGNNRVVADKNGTVND